MRIDRLYIDEFKNLRDFEIDLDKESLTTVFIGENGTGKSNLIEAIIVIFRDLYLGNRSNFKYKIEYEHSERKIEITSNTTPGSKRYEIREGGEEVTIKKFEKRKGDYLPSNIFAYYSGPNRRIESYFDEHLREFYKAQRIGEYRDIRPLFMARHVHSQFVLQAFYAFPETSSDEILKEYLNIEGLESVLFELKEPEWEGDENKGDSRFWDATGTVKDFLSSVWDEALAPIQMTASTREAPYKQVSDEERLYLYLKDQRALHDVAGQYETPREFFKHLESTYISDLIREVRTKVRVKDVNGKVTFRELSEGEQQLITVLGLLQFTKGEESLFLLDEPDTHLNPVWKIRYLDTVNRIVDPDDKNSHFILLTHDPLTIAGLEQSQVRIFDRIDGRVRARPPHDDPRGKGVAGVLTEMFGLSTSLDLETQKKLDERNELLASEDRSSEEEQRLRDLTEELEDLGFSTTFRDALYERFVKALNRHPEYLPPSDTSPRERKEQQKLAEQVLEEVLNRSE